MKKNLLGAGVIVLSVALVVIPARGADDSLDLAGVAVIPHVGTPGVRFRRPPLAPLDARVQLFLRNEAVEPFQIAEVRFNGRRASECVKGGTWSWHDSPEGWTGTERAIPAGALVVWSLNSVGHQIGRSLTLDVRQAQGRPGREFEVAIEKPRLWLSAITFLGPDASPYLDQVIFYVRNDTDQTHRIEDCRLFLPRNRDT